MTLRILGHRGASADFAENTLSAFVGAMTQGADGVELDVMRCASGELVVCHDEWLERLAGLKVEVLATPWRQLRGVDVGSRLGFGPAFIPLLDDVFQALPAHAQVNVELKCDTVEDSGLSLAVGDYVTQQRLEERVFISSFNPLCLIRLARGFPRLRRGFLVDPDRAFWPQAYFWMPVTANYSVHPHFSHVTVERMRVWRDMGLSVAVWTVDDAVEAARLRDVGVDFLITNRPGELRASLLEASHSP